MIEIMDYRLRQLDDANIVVERGGIVKEGKRAGEWVASRTGFYAHLGPALVGMFDRVVAAEVTGCDDLKTLAARVETIRLELLAAVAAIKPGKAPVSTVADETEGSDTTMPSENEAPENGPEGDDSSYE